MSGFAVNNRVDEMEMRLTQRRAAGCCVSRNDRIDQIENGVAIAAAEHSVGTGVVQNRTVD